MSSTASQLPKGIQQLTRTNKDGSKVTTFRVQVNKKKLNLKLDKVFPSLQEAVSCLNEALGIKTPIDYKSKDVQDIIANFIANGTLGTYIDLYQREYINKKYKDADPKTAEGKHKLRNWKNSISFLRTIKKTKIDDYEESGMHVMGLTHSKNKVEFASLDPRRVTFHHINSYVQTRLDDGMKPISIQREITFISNIFKKLKYLDPRPEIANIRNPVTDYDRDLLKSRGTIVKKKSFRLTEDDEAKLFKALDEYSNPELGQIVKLSLYTAMRRSEVVLLTWDQVFDDHIHLKHTKSGSDRIIHLTQQAKDILATIKKNSKNGNRLFSYTVLGMDGSFQKLLEVLDMKHIKFHGFRKEGISRIIEKVGASNSLLVAEILGIGSVKKLEENYIDKQSIKEIDSQAEALKQIGHSTARTTQLHYFSIKKK